ncbi:hypothetical protein [Halococcoides cellulosivorans]|uniref:Dnd system-associated protein 4 n=1 Tax=Halococcoides cellulosivorans TaxID=1679096 RepID=A0A2R4X408_9EURY|nr:hypothetical protein [Halococcoides cellulosivorans]AWB28520.1 hypothetical protein HARCEL1_12925 [Halococcoides cellulosivorans]
MITQKYNKSELYDRVVERHGIFENSYDFMVFLAVMGYRENRRITSEYLGNDGMSGEIGVDNLKKNELYRTVMACLAFQETNDPTALVNERKQAKILAQYAAGGLEIAEQEFGTVAGDPTDAVVNYIRSAQDEDINPSGELGKIVSSFDEEMMQDN